MCCKLRPNRITGEAKLCFVFVILNERQLKQETERQLRQNLLLLLIIRIFFIFFGESHNQKLLVLILYNMQGDFLNSAAITFSLIFLEYGKMLGIY